MAAVFYEKMAERLGYGLGSVLLLTLILLVGSVRKWLQNKGRSRSCKVELMGLCNSSYSSCKQRITVKLLSGA